MRVISVNVFFTLLLLLLAGCEDEPVQRDYPRVKTHEVTGITSEGALFTAEVTEPGSGLISEHGFVWALNNPGLEYDNKVFLGPLGGAGEFTAEIRSTLSEGNTYKVTAFAKAGDYTVYGNTVEFKSLGSLGPVITGFSPVSAQCGDTIRITGRNFSWVKASNIVRFNDVTAVVCDPATDTTLHVVVPFTLSARENTVSVEIAGNRSTYTQAILTVDLPVFESFSPVAGHWGDTVEIFLRNLRQVDNPLFLMGDINLIPIEPYDGRSVRIIVPMVTDQDYMTMSFIAGGGRFPSEDQFALLPPSISSFSPNVGFWPDTVTVYGIFNTDRQQTELLFGTIPGSVLSVTRDSLKVTVPEGLIESPVEITYRYDRFESVSAQMFALPAPRIDNVTPMTEFAGGYVTITGDYFIRDQTTVRFNNEPSKRIYVSRTSILCEAAGNITGEVRLSVSVSGRTTEYCEPFLLTNPEVISFTPQSVSPGDTLSITCNNSSRLAYPLIVPSGYGMQVLSVNGNTVKAIVPSGDYTSGRVAAYLYRSYTESIISVNDILTILEPEIYSVSPLAGAKGTLVTITGRNFSTVKEFNKITFQGVEVPVLSSTRSEIRFSMPLASGGEAPFSLSVCGHQVNSTEEFENLAAWSRLPELPMYDATCMMDFGDEILMTAQRGYPAMTIYRFNPGTSTFSPAGTVNTTITSFGNSVVKEGKAYFMGKNNDAFLMAFDRIHMSFTTVAPAPEALDAHTLLMDGDSVLFIGGGVLGYSSYYVRQFWKYRLSSGEWYRLNDLPFYCLGFGGFSINGRLFTVDLQRHLWEYFPVTDSWEPRAAYPGPSAGYNMNVVCNGKAYFGYGDTGYRSVFAYDPLTNQWSALADEQPGPRTWPLSFEYDGKIYLGSGRDFGTILTDFWVYDPSKE